MASFMFDPTITWEHVARHPRQFDAFEDPVSTSYVDTQQFCAAYGDALDTLDGTDLMSFVDYYFTETPMIQGTWVFKDDEVRQEFFDLCLESGCILTMKEIQEGETKCDKDARKAKETSNTAVVPALTAEWSDEWSEDEEEEEEHGVQEAQRMGQKEKATVVITQKVEEKVEGGRTNAHEQQKKRHDHHHDHHDHHDHHHDKKKKKSKGDGSQRANGSQFAPAATTTPKKTKTKKVVGKELVPPPLVPGLEHASKRTLVTAHMKKYGKGDQGRRAVQQAHSRDAIMREMSQLTELLGRVDISATERDTANARLDAIVPLLEHSA